MDCLCSDRGQPFPIDGSAADHLGKVYGTQVTGFIGEERLFSAGVGALDLPDLRSGIVLIDPIDEDDSRIPVFPGIIDDLLKDLTGIDGVNDLFRPWITKSILFIFFHGLHEFIRGRYRYIEIVKVMIPLFASDEIENVRMIHAEDSHIRSPSRSPLLNRLRRCIENTHERDRTARNSLCGTHHIIFHSEPGERTTST